MKRPEARLFLRTRVAAILLIPLPLLGIYYGAWLPYRAAREVLRMQNRLYLGMSAENAAKEINKSLALPMSTGRPEVVSRAVESIAALISASQSSGDAWEFAEYGERIALESGFDQGSRDLWQIVKLYDEIWKKYKNPLALAKKEEFLLKARKISPKQPLTLYMLFDTYQAMGDIEKRNEVGCKILELWPNEVRLQGLPCKYLTNENKGANK